MRGRPGIYMVMGMAIDRWANLIHAVWTAIDLAYGSREPTEQAVEPSTERPVARVRE